MDPQTVERLIRELDTIVPREGAHVRLEQLDGGPQESVVSANREGYLRLGIEFLKAAVAPEATTEEHAAEPASVPDPGASDNGETPPPRQQLRPVDIDLDYLITKDSLVRFTVFRRGQLEVSDAPSKAIPIDRIMTVGCLFLAAIAAFFAVIGFSEVITWINM